MSRTVGISRNSAELLTFTLSEDSAIEVRFEDQTIWLSQKLMAELFGVEVPTISHHLKQVFEEGELSEVATI